MTPQELKEKIDIVEIISKHLKLKKKGLLYWSNCIFHKEKTASFVVNQEKKFYHCFGCGVSGDVFLFLMHIENKSFQEVIEDLHKYLGIIYKPIIYNNIQVRLEELLEKANNFYEKQLYNYRPAIDYLKNRKIEEESIKYFRLGYSHENTVVEELLGKGYSLQEMKDAGIISYINKDRFRNRIIFPIFNLQNKIIGFGGRSIDNTDPKYLNSNDNNLFHKNISLYHSQILKIPHQEVYLVEGYMDVIRMYQKGFINTVATMGTSISGHQLLLILKKTNTINIFLDGDKAGEKALEKIILLLLSLIKINYQIYIIIIKNQDPDEYLQNTIGAIEKIKIKIEDYIFNKIIENISYEEDLPKLFYRFNYYTKHIRDRILQNTYTTLWKKKINNFIKNNINKKSQKLSFPKTEELIISILILYPDLLEEFWDSISIFEFSNSFLEEIKNKLVNNTFQPTNHTDKIINNYKILLNNHKFAKKYLIDLIYGKKNN
ncbi:DNA primase [Rickettsiales bacterium (ex Bugula neritina AB1)]|nr:DNA primase [Rickettsiales bacterium (ex Bugula neritina AB1)]